jgi:hypothetical protein
MNQRTKRSTQSGLDGVTHWLIYHAARRAPESLSSRLGEEWLADMDFRSSALSRFRLALGCCWASVVIVNDFTRAPVPATSPVVTANGNITLADRNFGYFSLRSGTLFLILGLHAALFCGLITTLSPAQGLATPPSLPKRVLDSVASGIEIPALPRR